MAAFSFALIQLDAEQLAQQRRHFRLAQLPHGALAIRLRRLDQLQPCATATNLATYNNANVYQRE